MELVFFRFWRTDKMDSVMKGLMRQCPPEFLGYNRPCSVQWIKPPTSPPQIRPCWHWKYWNFTNCGNTYRYIDIANRFWPFTAFFFGQKKVYGYSVVVCTLGWFTYVRWKNFFCRLECTPFHFVHFVMKCFCAKNYSNQMTFGGCSMAWNIFLWHMCSPYISS